MEGNTPTTIPNHWLIDTGPSMGWHLKEGIWVHKDYDPILRVAAVYLGLKDIPEASAELHQCHEQFMTKVAPKMIKWGITQKALVQRTGTLKSIRPDTAPGSPEDDQLITGIFLPWVDKWVFGSKPMLKWLIAISTLEGICQPIGLSVRQLRGYNGRPGKKLIAFASQLNPELAWAWKLLLSGDYQRAEKTARELARRTVQAQGYHHLEERVLLVQARWWIMFYIFGFTQGDILELIAQQHREAPFDEPYLSARLRLYNSALEITPKLSRQKQTRHREFIEDFLDQLKNK